LTEKYKGPLCKGFDAFPADSFHVHPIFSHLQGDGGGFEKFLVEDTMKKMPWIVWMSLTALFLILMFQECKAGVVIEQVVKDREGRASQVFLYFSGERLRTDDEGGGLTTIMDFKGDRMVMVDHRSKNYVEIKFSQWEKEVSKRLKKDLPTIKPKVRKIVVKRVEETATINGFRTEKIEIRADGELIEENWVTRDVDMGEIEKVMERVAQGFSKEFRSEMKEGREIYEKLKPYGFPILVKDYTITYGLGAIDVLEVKKLERKDLKDEVFLPPAGYQRIVPETPKK
jgi:hypothetical protein